jgi:hypothetical protein
MNELLPNSDKFVITCCVTQKAMCCVGFGYNDSEAHPILSPRLIYRTRHFLTQMFFSTYVC